jgi:hypothetical protein
MGCATRYPRRRGDPADRGYLSPPGRTPARAGVLALIIMAAAAALWFLVFRWAPVHLPVDTSGSGG